MVDTIIMFELMECALEVTQTDLRGHLRYKVNQYVFLLLLRDLLNIYTTLLTAINVLVEKLLQLSIEEVARLRKMVNKFRLLTDRTIFFV
jgi:hypothetical protein